MIKRVLTYLVVVIVIFIVTFFLNQFLLIENSTETTFSLLNIYFFHATACIIVYLLAEITASYIPNNVGYLYLALTTIKIGLFVLIFKESVLENTLTKPEKISLITPFFVFLALEALFISKLMNTKSFKKE